MGDHAVGVPDDVVLVALGKLVDVGEGLEAPPALVLVRPPLEAVPAVVGRVLALAVGAVPEDALAVKVDGVGPGVGIDPVQNDLHAPFMGGGAEGAEVGLCAQHGVGAFVVGGVVAVVGEGHGDGIQVEDTHPQLGQAV